MESFELVKGTWTRGRQKQYNDDMYLTLTKQNKGGSIYLMTFLSFNVPVIVLSVFGGTYL